jgi:flagellin
MAVVNTNVNASLAQNALSKNERAMNSAMAQLSTGFRINTASDDAAGLSVSSKMTSQINGLAVGIRNANDAISMISTADGAAVEITNMLQRMRELALQSANGTTTSNDRAAMSTEYGNLLTEIERIGQNTQWNGGDIMDGTYGSTATAKFQVGANGGQTIAVNFGVFTSAAATAGTSGYFHSLASSRATLSQGATGASAVATASNALTLLDAAITTVNTQRSTYGAAINQLTFAVDNMSQGKSNTEAARSRVLDTDYAAATSELARTQIIQQAGTAMLAQANQIPSTVLSLLR